MYLRSPLLLLPLLLLACSKGNPEIEDTGELPRLECEGDGDGRIQASELEVLPGISVPYVANALGTRVSVDVEGALEGATRVWDFREGPTDLKADLRVLDAVGTWYEDAFDRPEFASATFLQAPDLLGVYRADDDEVLLLGYASREEDPTDGRTLLVYDEPVPVLRFPMAKGSTWSAEAAFSGALLQGVQNQGQERWDLEIDEIGSLRLKGFTLENTLRMRITMTQTLAVSAGAPTHVYRQVLFLRECFGDLVRVVAPVDADPGFAEAVELHRLDVE
jgi:hypothetical protein